MSAAAPTGSAARNPALDVLRVGAAIAVLVKHASLATGQQLRPGWGWMNHFEIAPTLFFAMSAYLVYLPFVRALVSGAEPVAFAVRFIARRAVRIIPLYWCALVVLYAFDRRDAHGIGIAIDGWQGAVELATFTHIYDPHRFFNGIAAAYTLDVEVSFYLFIVAWVYVVHRWARRSARPLRVVSFGLISLLGVNALWRFAIVQWRPNGLTCSATTTHWTCAAANWLPGFLDYFVIGMALAVAAVAWEPNARPQWVARSLRHPSWWFVTAAAAFAVYATRYGTLGLESLTGIAAEIRHELNGVMALALLTPAALVAPRRGWLAAFLGAPAFRWLALWSYGFYLWHQGFIDAGLRLTGGQQFHGNFAIVGPFALFWAFLAAAISWRLVEAPLQRWARPR